MADTPEPSADITAKSELESFNPRSPDYRWRLRVRVVTPNRVYHYTYWRRIFGLLLVLALLGWSGVAGGIWAFLKFGREWEDASYTDVLLLPWRREEFRTGLAKHNLALGLEQIEKKNYHYGYALLQSAISRVPADLNARRQLAITQVRFGLLPRALDTLAEGVRYNPDLPYLKLLFGWLLEAREDERILKLAQQMLPATPDRKLEHLFVALQAATAHFERGRYDETERIVATWGLFDALEGQILLAKCEAERGASDRALARLESQMARFPKRDELFFELIRLQRQLGKHDAARRLSLLRHLNDPASHGPRIDLLHAYHATDDHAAVQREIENFLRDFGGDAAALDLIAWFGVTSHRADLLKRLRDLAEARQHPPHAIILSQVHEALLRESYEEALALADAAPAMTGDDVPAARRLIDGLRAVALFGLGKQEARVALVTFLEKSRLRASDALMIAHQLELLNEHDESRLVLERACAVDPFNEAALAELVRIDALSGNREGLAEYLPRLLTKRKPPRRVLEETLLALDRPADAALVADVRTAIQNSPVAATP